MTYGYGYGWTHHRWQDWNRRAIKLVETVEGPVIPITALRAQCEVMTTDVDSDGVETSPHDDLLLAYLAAAVEHAENFTGLSIAQRTWEMALDAFPCGSPWNVGYIELLRPPVVGIESFTAVEGGSDGELDEGDDYILDDFSNPPRLFPVVTWPVMTRQTNGIRILYRAGYRNEVSEESDWTDAPMMPNAIRQALLLLVGHLFENRADTADKVVTTVPNGFEALLAPVRVRVGLA